MRMRKKGAIEMSMQTIIVVIIGVTLLALGIRFVVNTMGSTTSMADQVFAQGDTQIGEIFGESEEILMITPDSVSVAQGDSERSAINIRNTGSEDATFKISMTVEEAPNEAAKTAAKSWITYVKSDKTLGGGDTLTRTLLINPPATAKIGTYMISVVVTCTGPDCTETESSKEVIITVKGG